MSQLARLINFYHTPGYELIITIEEYVVKSIKEKGEIELSPDMNVLELRPSQYFIVTPDVLKNVIETLSERLKSNKDIQVSITDNVLKISKRKEEEKKEIIIVEPQKPEPRQKQELELKPIEEFSDPQKWINWLFERIINVESIQVNLNIEKVDSKDVPSIKIMLANIKKYVKESSVKTKDGKFIKCVIRTANHE
jgi:hypothetical protein